MFLHFTIRLLCSLSVDCWWLEDGSYITFCQSVSVFNVVLTSTVSIQDFQDEMFNTVFHEMIEYLKASVNVEQDTGIPTATLVTGWLMVISYVDAYAGSLPLMLILIHKHILIYTLGTGIRVPTCILCPLSQISQISSSMYLRTFPSVGLIFGRSQSTNSYMDKTKTQNTLKTRNTPLNSNLKSKGR